MGVWLPPQMHGLWGYILFGISGFDHAGSCIMQQKKVRFG